VSELVHPRDIEQFRDVVSHTMGLQFDDQRIDFLGEVLQRRVGRSGLSAEAYLNRLSLRVDGAEHAALARELTVGETYFFRNSDQFRALVEAVLPERMQANAFTRTLHIVSAGCASGEEPYSIAIVLRDAIPDPSWTLSIRAVDLNPAALEKAARARYGAWALRETPPQAQKRWFQPVGRELVLDEAVREAVCFEARNLAGDNPDLWQPASLDVVFCRNVMMYFAPEQARALVARIARALQPGGYLFLGHAETLRALSDDFHLRHTHNTFYYQLKETAEPEFPHQQSPAAPAPAPAGISEPALNEAWVDLIREASERVKALAQRNGAASPAAVVRPVVDLVRVFDLLRMERFAEALAVVRALPPEAAADPDVLLLEAMLLAHSRQLPEAEEACRRLLAIDDMNAGAHYDFALCRESAGERAAAAEHDRIATYLDPAFAMPRLHLGLLARRAGDLIVARRELSQALILLRREDASRLLLFGGGFNREALLGLCESALHGAGGQR
jgi:chemotaxis protein methyltransferase CheR